MTFRNYSSISEYFDQMIFDMNSNFETNSCINLTYDAGFSPLVSVAIGLNAQSNEYIYYFNLTPNFYITNSSSLYNPLKNVTDAYVTDITQWIWPRPATELTNWSYSLPSFNLLSQYSIHVGKNYATNLILTPFSHWQNALFIISVNDINTNDTPKWIMIDQPNKSITVNVSQVSSTGIFNVSMAAKMITYFINSIDTSKYTTKDYFVSLEFFNDNCVFVSSNATYFLVINKMTTIMLMFTDNEGDSITFKSYNNDLISNYNRATNNTEQYQMILQANEARNDPSTMLFNYTDFYHKDASFVQNITLEFYLFSVDPPSFANDLQVVHANRWSNVNVELPATIDPNGLNWTISLDPSIPAWIILDNRILTLKTTNFNYNISETTIVSLKIVNEKNAWIKYNLTIVTASYISPSFGVIQNITAYENTQTEVKLELQSGLDINVIDWTNNNTITWIKFDI